MKLAHDGVQLSFDIAGAGPLQFLFIHGLGGDRTHFAPQMEYFARQGRALNAELRGHGESDKPQQAYSIEGFAEDLVWLCTRQQITKPVIVGQSMGGNMALEIAAGHPEDIADGRGALALAEPDRQHRALVEPGQPRRGQRRQIEPLRRLGDQGEGERLHGISSFRW